MVPRRGPQGRKSEYAVLAEKALGHALPKRAVVHHVDENPNNNSPSNLIICENQTYHMLLHYRADVIRAGGDPNRDRLCNTCHNAKPVNEFHVRANRPGGRQSKCKQCYRELFQRKQGIS